MSPLQNAINRYARERASLARDISEAHPDGLMGAAMNLAHLVALGARIAVLAEAESISRDRLENMIADANRLRRV